MAVSKYYNYDFNLHSTMYLLNPVGLPTIPNITVSFTFHYVSIKSMFSVGMPIAIILFTFHYVSIKSWCK